MVFFCGGVFFCRTLCQPPLLSILRRRSSGLPPGAHPGVHAVPQPLFQFSACLDRVAGRCPAAQKLAHHAHARVLRLFVRLADSQSWERRETSDLQSEGSSISRRGRGGGRRAARDGAGARGLPFLGPWLPRLLLVRWMMDEARFINFWWGLALPTFAGINTGLHRHSSLSGPGSGGSAGPAHPPG